MTRLVVMGVAGCGKSVVGAALAQAMGVPYRDGDDLHPPENIAKMRAGLPLEDVDRWPWLALVGQSLAGARGVVGCSALKRSYRDFITQTAGTAVTFVHLSGSRAVIAARLAARSGHFMPPALLDSQFAALEPPTTDESAITVQIDQPVHGIVADVLAGLATQANPPPRKPPRMVDIALAIGVSPMTVSRAFKRPAQVSDATRHAVLRAAEGFGYVFDATASTLRSQKTGFVAVVVPSMTDAHSAAFVSGLMTGLKGTEFQILLGDTQNDIHEEERLIEQLLHRRPQAFVVAGGNHTDRARRLLVNAAVPVVETGDLPANPIGHVVGCSNAAAVGALVDHFVAVGHRRIAFVGSGDDQPRTNRRHGFIAAMQRHHLDATGLIAAKPALLSPRAGAEAMTQVLCDLPDTDAVICDCDLLAFGALMQCQRCGIAVPDRMAIAGFGNHPIGALCTPGLTTVHLDPLGIGEQTAALIINSLNGSQTGAKHICVPAELLVRQSSR